MAAKVKFDPALGAVVTCSEFDVTRDTMRDTIRMVTGELAANNCRKLLVDMTRARIQVSVSDTTFVLDQLLNATQGDLHVALVINDNGRPHGEYAIDYLSAEEVDIEIFTCADDARRWIAAA